MAQVVPPIDLPDAEFLAQVFLTPIVSPTPVATRLPQPEKDEDTVNGFVRVELSSVVKCDPLTPNPFYDISVLTHCYSPVEVQAADLANTVLKNVAAARGLTIANWYVVRVMGASGGQRLTDPMVNLIRYRGLFTWTVAP